MYAILFPLLGMLMEAVVVFRGLRARLISRFPLFYSYLLAVLIQDVIRYIAYLRFSQEVFANVYWSTQFVSLVMGSIVIFEIYRLALEDYPGTARMARNLLFVAFLGVLLKAVLTTHYSSSPWMIALYVKLERDLRFVQAIAILVLIVVFLWYAIPLGRNLGAIFLGYGVFVAISVLQLTVVNHYQSRAQTFWNIVQPVSYSVVVTLWLIKLWSADAVTQKSRRKSVPGDYGELAGATGRSLEEARARLGSAVRP
jgi:hypothetical protein